MSQGRHLKLQVPEYFRKHKLVFPKHWKLLFLLTSRHEKALFIHPTYSEPHDFLCPCLNWVGFSQCPYFGHLSLLLCNFSCSYSHSKEVEEFKVICFPMWRSIVFNTTKLGLKDLHAAYRLSNSLLSKDSLSWHWKLSSVLPFKVK